MAVVEEDERLLRSVGHLPNLLHPLAKLFLAVRVVVARARRAKRCTGRCRRIGRAAEERAKIGGRRCLGGRRLSARFRRARTIGCAAFPLGGTGGAARPPLLPVSAVESDVADRAGEARDAWHQSGKARFVHAHVSEPFILEVSEDLFVDPRLVPELDEEGGLAAQMTVKPSQEILAFGRAPECIRELRE